MTTLAEANAILEAQRAFFREDAEIEREAAIWRDASPEERFAAVIALCAEADYFLSQLAPDELARALRPEPSPHEVSLLPPAVEPCGDWAPRPSRFVSPIGSATWSTRSSAPA